MLEPLVRACPWLQKVLVAVRAAGMDVGQECWVGAGVIRDLVLDVHFGGCDPARLDVTHVKDIDVAFFEPSDVTPSAEAAVQDALARRLPGLPWEAKNQAAVHLWYERRFGSAVEPLTSIADAVATWPETASAVAVRLLPDGTLAVVAPLGLDDLLEGVYRRNPRRVSVEEYRRRLAAKQPEQRWPGLRVEP